MDDDCADDIVTHANDLCHEAVKLRATDGRRVIELVNAYIVATSRIADPSMALCVQSTRPFCTGRRGATVLHLVCERGVIEAFDHVLDLCSVSIFLDLVMDDHATALYVAQLPTKGKSDDDVLYMSKKLVDRGADCFISRVFNGWGGTTPLYQACEFNRLEVAKFLLKTMLDARGITLDNFLTRQCQERLQQVVYASISKYSLLHASVCVGGQCRAVFDWLISDECRILWPGGSLREFVNYSRDKYGRTALNEAARSTDICMYTIRKLYELGSGYTAVHLVNITNALNKSHVRQSSLATEIDFVTFMYEKASLCCDFNSLAPEHTLPHMVRWFGRTSGLLRTDYITFSNARAISDVILRLVDRYPSLFTPRYVSECREKALGQIRTSDTEAATTALSVMILLGWYPCDELSLVNLFKTGLRFDEETLVYYARRFVRNADLTNIKQSTLRLIVAHGSLSLRAVFITEGQTRHSQPHQYFKHIATEIIRHNTKFKSEYDNDDARFLLWAFENRVVPQKFQLSDVLYRCAPSIACCLLKHMLLHSYRYRNFICFEKIVQPRLLSTVVWNTSITPTQVFARMFIKDTPVHSRAMRTEFVEQVLWVYNLRHMTKEPRKTKTEPVRKKGVAGKQRQHIPLECRIILGPKKKRMSPKPLPFNVSQLLIELLWEGCTEPLQFPDLDQLPKRLKASRPVSRPATRANSMKVRTPPALEALS